MPLALPATGYSDYLKSQTVKCLKKNPPVTINVRHCRRPGWQMIAFAYDTAAVALIKKTVPYPNRRWQANGKCWIIADESVPLLLAVFEKAGGYRVQR